MAFVATASVSLLHLRMAAQPLRNIGHGRVISRGGDSFQAPDVANSTHSAKFHRDKYIQLQDVRQGQNPHLALREVTKIVLIPLKQRLSCFQHLRILCMGGFLAHHHRSHNRLSRDIRAYDSHVLSDKSSPFLSRSTFSCKYSDKSKAIPLSS